jgi:hypothetical protein
VNTLREGDDDDDDDDDDNNNKNNKTYAIKHGIEALRSYNLTLSDDFFCMYLQVYHEVSRW